MNLPFKTPPVTAKRHWRHFCRPYSSYLEDKSRGIITFLGLLKLLVDPPLLPLCRIYRFNLPTMNSSMNEEERLGVHLHCNVTCLRGRRWILMQMDTGNINTSGSVPVFC